ncbi:hypothetical protein [Rubinisphaera sp.]|uniref:hypothetical protein n=1 Tax=Rubinisphaera sp. TaxID=2024857 RepID=UPI000C111A14|nr:hypothetical protein [Rubinisphaera sp.]MBV08506.1 hypothetical protein [Rubinisphaera sp.]
MKVWKKQTKRYLKNGKQVNKSVAGSKAKTVLSKRFYGTLRTFDDKRKQIPLTEDRKSSESLLNRLQSDHDHKRSIGYTEQDDKRNRPLSDVLNEYIDYLRAKGNTAEYVKTCEQRLRKLFFATTTKTTKTIKQNTKAKSGSRSTKTTKATKFDFRTFTQRVRLDVLNG